MAQLKSVKSKQKHQQQNNNDDVSPFTWSKILDPEASWDKGSKSVYFFFAIFFFFLGLTGVCGNQALFLAGLGYTCPTIAAAMQLTQPVLTFLLTIIIGMEKVNLKRLEGKLKVGGILVLVAGALIMTLLRGPTVLGSSLLGFQLDHWHIGMLSLVANCISFYIYIVQQGKTLKEFPTNLSVTTYSYLFGSILMSIIGFLSTRVATDWTLTTPQLLAAVYAGIVASAICLCFELTRECLCHSNYMLCANATPTFFCSFLGILVVVLLQKKCEFLWVGLRSNF